MAMAAMLSVVATFVASAQPSAGSGIPTNLELMARCAGWLGDSVLAGSSDSVCARVAAHPASWLIDQGLVESAARKPVRIVSCDAPAVSVAILSIGVSYQEADDRLARDVSLRAVVLAESSGRERTSRTVSVAVRDTIDADLLETVENSGYEFTRGAPPPSGGGFWSKVVEPAVVLGATVVMTILLFTVRSQ